MPQTLKAVLILYSIDITALFAINISFDRSG
jgi:hypothetical protein